MKSTLQKYIFVSIFAVGYAAACSAAGAKEPFPEADPPVTSAHIAAAMKTATSNVQCQKIHPFFFEIGDRTGTITSASIGGTTYQANTQINIASATKWLFGAYVAEIRAGVLTKNDILATQMQSGYASMGNECASDMTVSACFSVSPNNVYTDFKRGRFHYSSGHYQKWGIDNGLASMTAHQLADEFRRVLGKNIPLTFNNPLLAGGAVMSAEGYAVFLRKIMNSKLRITKFLGSQKICTLTGKCPTANYSPLNLPWHYSVGHWVEDDPQFGDGAFSSPGAFGFYPWINSTKSYYGIISREDVKDIAVTASINCGRTIRKAFLTGVAQ